MGDLAYNYFKLALKTFLVENGKNQTWLALKLGVEDATVSRYFSDKRSIPFAKQTEIANVCGFEYIDFLQYGRALFSPTSADTVAAHRTPANSKRIKEEQRKMDNVVKQLLEYNKELLQQVKQLTEENATLKAELKYRLGGRGGVNTKGQPLAPHRKINLG